MSGAFIASPFLLFITFAVMKPLLITSININIEKILEALVISNKQLWCNYLQRVAKRSKALLKGGELSAQEKNKQVI